MAEKISRLQAARLGLTRFFTGNICQKCGEVAEKLVSNNKCVVCQRVKTKARKKRTLAEARAYHASTQEAAK